MRNNFRTVEKPAMHKQCSCGAQMKLIKRRNFTHGKKSGGRSHRVYKCKECMKEIPLGKKPSFGR